MGKDHELIQAVKAEDVATVMRIVGKAKLKPKRSGSSKKSPLNFQDPDGFSALHHAALNGNCHILSLLLSTNQVYSDIKDNKGMRPLHYAAWQGKIEPVEQLLRAGANPSEPSLGGVTPLHLSSQYGSYSVVEALLQYKADPFLEQKEGKTPLDFAAEFGRLKVAELLLGSCQALIHLDGHSRTGHKLHTPLHLAAKNGHSDVASVLLDHGIDINIETHNGTALHEAALAGKSEVVSLLINSGIDVLKKDSMGQTALDIVNKFTSNRAAADIKTLLRDAIGGSQAKAIKDFMRLHDRAALSFKAGDIINVIERNPDGRWKGSLKKGSNECIGYFPRDHVQLIRGSPSTSESNNYPGSPPPFPQSGFPIMPANTYQSIAPASPLSEQTKRYSTGSTASASSSGNWSNRGSTDPTVTSGMRPNHLPVGGVPDPPTTLPPAPPGPYNGIGHEEFPPPPPEMLNNNHSPQGTLRYHNDIRSHGNANTHSNYQGNHASPKKMNYPIPPWLTGAKFSDESGVDMSSSSNENIERKDADRIYDWLRQHRLVEYTNNFTLAGYDMPTIAKMTPEDLTAIGVTKPAHRKRITAMISNLKEQDPLPKYIPGDVGTWLRLLDLSQYYNTLISNDYGTMDKVAQITWEDLQEIGINRLGDEKKFTLAIKRLNYLKKHGGGEKIQSPSYPGSLNSDSGSPSPAASLEGHTNQTYPPPAQFAPSNRRASPQLTQRQDETHLTVQRRSGGLRSSRESLASDASIGSAGSHGSHDQLRQHDPNARTTPATNQTINEGIESTYVPAMSSFRIPGQGAKKSASLHSLDETNGMSFSTFKQPQISPEEAALRKQVRSTESLDRLMAAQAMADRFKRNSLEGGSSIASSGSGSGEQPAVKLKKSLPPAPPKRTNSVAVHSKDYEQKTATIGRKKSLKKFREEMQLYRAEFDAEFGAGTFDGSASRIEGYATIKRTSKKIDPTARLQRSQSQEGDLFRGVPPAPVAPPTFPGQTKRMDGTVSMSHSSEGYHMQQNSNYQLTGVHPNTARTNLNQPSSVGGRDYAQSGHSGSYPQAALLTQAFQPTSNNRPALNLDNPSVHYQTPSLPNYGQQRATHTQQQNGGIVNRVHAGQAVTTHDQVPRTLTSVHSDRPNYQSSSTNSHGTSVPNKPVRTGVPLELHQPVNGSKFVCPPDNKSALPGAQVPVSQSTRHRKNSQDHMPGQSRKTSVSEHSTTSNDSGGSSGRRPSSLEMTWKNQQSIEDDAAPVIQSALTNPLENIWRPKSRHLVRKGSMDKQESISSGSEKSDSSSSEATQIRTDATFLQLKKQFLERDSQAPPPAAYSTLTRNSKKPEPLTGNLRVQGFSDQDEYNQSPVAKHPPMEIPDVRAVPATMSNSDSGHKLAFPQPPPSLKTPVAVFGKPTPQQYEKPKSTPASPRSRRDDLQSRVEKIAAGRRDPSPTKGLSSFGNNPLHLHIADIPPAPDFAAPVPGRMSVSPTGSAASPPLPPPPPPLQSAMGGPTPLQLQSIMGGPQSPPLPSAMGGPPPPPPPPPPVGLALPKKDNSANNNNSQGILKPAGPKSRPPVKLMPDMSDLQRELQRRTSKTNVSNSSVEEAIKRNQEEQRKEQAKVKDASSPIAEIVSPTLRKLSKPSLTSKPISSSSSLDAKQNQERPNNASPEVVSPALRKLSKPPATKKKPVAPPPTKPRSPIARQELPRDDEKDVDIFSQDLDKMEMEDDVVESDGSSDMESGVSGFEKENTDTIKKQPTKTSPPRPTLPLSDPAPVASAYQANKPRVDSTGASWEDNDDGMDTIKRRPKEERLLAEEEEKRDSLGEAMEKLEALLNSPDGELVMGDFASPMSTPEKRKAEQPPPDPRPVEPPKEDKAESAENMSAEEESKVFNDLESMFESLAMDLENMLQ